MSSCQAVHPWSLRPPAPNCAGRSCSSFMTRRSQRQVWRLTGPRKAYARASTVALQLKPSVEPTLGVEMPTDSPVSVKNSSYLSCLNLPRHLRR
jgi:hypothetical protein